jgi:hypothetical protein
MAWSRSWAAVVGLTLAGTMPTALANAAGREPRPAAPNDDPCPEFDVDAPENVRRAIAHVQVKEARKHLLAGDPTGALQAVGVAQRWWPSPEQDLLRAQIHVATDSCTRARAAMDRYLASEPADFSPAAARRALEHCAPAGPPPPPEPPAPVWYAEAPPPPLLLDLDTSAPPAATSLPTSLHPGDRPQRRHWIADPLGAGLSGAGLGLMTLGAIAVTMARRDDETKPNHFASDNPSQRFRIAGGITVAAGTGLLIGGIVRYVLLTRRDSGSGSMAARTRPGRALAGR